MFYESIPDWLPYLLVRTNKRRPRRLEAIERIIVAKMNSFYMRRDLRNLETFLQMTMRRIKAIVLVKNNL